MTPAAYTMILASAADSGSMQTSGIGDGLVLMVVGMFVVFLALVLVGTALIVIRKLAGETRRKPEAVPSPPNAPSAGLRSADRPPSSGDVDLKLISVIAAAAAQAQMSDTRLIAVLSAAATAALGTPVRVRRVQFLKARTDGAWAAAGRAQIHSSHQFSKRKRR